MQKQFQTINSTALGRFKQTDLEACRIGRSRINVTHDFDTYALIDGIFICQLRNYVVRTERIHIIRLEEN